MSNDDTIDFVRHLIECHCILKIFQNKTKPIYHKFPVFSKYSSTNNDNTKEIEKKFVVCNNCDVVHEVYDICKSNIMWGNEGFLGLVLSKDDISFNLKNKNNDAIVEILEKNDCDISIWELVDFCIENNIDQKVVLTKKEVENNIIYNVLNISNKSVSIKKEIEQRYI